MLENNWHKKEEPFLSMSGLGGGSFQRVLTTSSERTYIDDIFSTFLYHGSGSNRSINNGIDLSGEGGMVWFTNRATHSDYASRWAMFDTERGAGKFVYSNENWVEQPQDLTELSAFNSNGFSLGDNSGGFQATNHTTTTHNADHYVSWTFRKAPGFFDVVTYTGNGTAGRTVSHSLGSVPGAIWVKCTSHADSWGCYHRSTGNTKATFLNSSGTPTTNGTPWNNTDPTSTEFTLGADNQFNGNGRTYVAYIFGHDDQSFGESGNQAVIKCGSYTGTGSANITETLGFEPQWLLVKNVTTDSQDWTLVDTMRGFGTGVDERLDPNNQTLADSTFNVFEPTTTGFKLGSSVLDETNKNGDTHIYIAIARPHKPPTAGTEVFAIDVKTAATTTTPQYTSGFPVDLLIRRNQIDSSDYPEFQTRLTGAINYISEVGSGWTETGSLNSNFAFNNGVFDGSSARATDYHWMFKRAPKFLDIVTYIGDGQNSRSINHNLGVAPELVIIKNRFNTSSGSAFHVVHTTEIPADNSLRLNEDYAKAAAGVDSYPTSTAFPVSDATSVNFTLNKSADKYVAYVFASLSGVSKIGSYSGTGNDINVDCGFTAGARFVLIKRTDSAGDWYIWDTTRGIASGNDPYIQLNNNTAHVTNTDYIDPLNAGFTVTSSANADINADGGSYFFFAIA